MDQKHKNISSAYGMFVQIYFGIWVIRPQYGTIASNPDKLFSTTKCFQFTYISQHSTFGGWSSPFHIFVHIYTNEKKGSKIMLFRMCWTCMASFICLPYSYCWVPCFLGVSLMCFLRIMFAPFFGSKIFQAKNVKTKITRLNK